METTGLRHFELVDEKSSKFWEVSVDGSDLTTRWGRIGTNGQTKIKSLATLQAAESERDKVIAQKLRKGYRETTVENVDAEPVNCEEPERTTAVEPEPLSGEESAPAIATESESEISATRDAGGPVGGVNVADMIAQMTDGSLSLEDALVEFDNRMQQTESGSSPSRVRLAPFDGDVFDGASRLTRWSDEIRNAGYEDAGDFRIHDIHVSMRGFFQEPNVLIAVSQVGGYQWIDLSIANADDTWEVWSSVPEHDGIVAPWATLHLMQNADFAELHETFVRERSNKEPARLSVDRYVELFEQEYSRQMAWRETAGNQLQDQPEVSERIIKLVRQFARESNVSGLWKEEGSLDSVPSGAEIMKLTASDLANVHVAVVQLTEEMVEQYRDDVLEPLHDYLSRRKLPFTQSNVECLSAALLHEARSAWGGGLDLDILRSVERYAERNPLNEATCRLLRGARTAVTSDILVEPETIRRCARIDALTGDDKVVVPVQADEVWSDAVIADLAKVPVDQRAVWIQLIWHCGAATMSKPSSDWQSRAELLLHDVTREDFRDRLGRWLPLINKPTEIERFRHDPLYLDEHNQNVLRGLIWCVGLMPDESVPRLLADTALSAYRKIRRIGARATRVGNACVYALGAISTPDCLAQLALLNVKVKSGSARRIIGKQLEDAAARQGVSRADLEEMTVPTYGLDGVGIRRETLGEFTVELIVIDDKVQLTWLKSDGKTQKSVPAAVKSDFADDLKELKSTVKDIGKMLGTQRERLDGLFLRSASWSLEAWRERYLDHFLLGTLARRLIWQFETGSQSESGIWWNDSIRAADGQELKLEEETSVQLWHPLNQSVETVMLWRTWLEERQITQPFKQAHREVYILTDAERGTGTYSNRQGAHILRQAQYRTLAQSRGWSVNLLGAWDGGGEGLASRPMSERDMRAEFYVTYAEENDNDRYETGVRHVTTDQIRFFSPSDASGPMPLTRVPPQVFSEIMRDIDLFVGVASVGNDPNWNDGGPDGLFQDYWNIYSFGQLTETAVTRRDILKGLIPRLKIAERCSLEDRSLVVRGDLRTYYIHLGSSNIRMSPNDQYLCIVPSKSVSRGADKVRLPFEGDPTLSIILSKAFLLADDTKISDPDIVSQLQQ
jgi:predicted DNA-binding WGR domain protein